jgi:hypothetical protein
MTLDETIAQISLEPKNHALQGIKPTLRKNR